MLQAIAAAVLILYAAIAWVVLEIIVTPGTLAF